MSREVEQICRTCLWWLPADVFKEQRYAYGYCQRRDAYKPEHLTCTQWVPKGEYIKQEQPCDTCTNDKGCVTCKDGELWEGKKQPSEDLEKYASRAGFDYVDDIDSKYPGHRWNDHDVEFAYRDGIIAGAEWQKEQMLKGAVEGEVYKFGAVAYVKEHNNAELTKYLSPFNHGDSVKIVIVKEDKE